VGFDLRAALSILKLPEKFVWKFKEQNYTTASQAWTD
jgi:hypothetical protein